MSYFFSLIWTFFLLLWNDLYDGKCMSKKMDGLLLNFVRKRCGTMQAFLFLFFFLGFAEIPVPHLGLGPFGTGWRRVVKFDQDGNEN